MKLGNNVKKVPCINLRLLDKKNETFMSWVCLIPHISTQTVAKIETNASLLSQGSKQLRAVVGKMM